VKLSMDTTDSKALPLQDNDSDQSSSLDNSDFTDENIDSEESTPKGKVEIQWEVVARESGLATAQILANRLRAEGIPAHAWQEGAGLAFGLTIGKLGTGYVMVPEQYKEEALSILAVPVEPDYDDLDDWAEDE